MSVTLTPAQLEIVLDALADAEIYREQEGGTGDFAAAQAYLDLAHELTRGAQS